MTLSTSGIVPKMYALADEDMPITLAVSLHAPDDATRQRIMPIAKRYPLEDILKAAQHYFDVTGRKVTYEYILIKNVTCTHDSFVTYLRRHGVSITVRREMGSKIQAACGQLRIKRGNN